MESIGIPWNYRDIIDRIELKVGVLYIPNSVIKQVDHTTMCTSAV